MAQLKSRVLLTKFAVNGFRSLKDTTFEPEDKLSVLIGPNGSGKTNVLHAIHLLSQLDRMRHSARNSSVAQPCKISATFRIRGRSIRYRAILELASTDRNREMLVGCREEWGIEELTGEAEWVEIPSFALEHAGKIPFPARVLDEMRRSSVATYKSSARNEPADFRRVFGILEKLDGTRLNYLRAVTNFKSSIKYYSASQFTDPSRCPSSFEIDANDRVLESYDNKGPHLSFLAGLHETATRDKAAFESYLQVVGPKGIGLIDSMDWKRVPLSSHTVEVKTGGKLSRITKRRLLVVPIIRIGNAKLSFNQLSEGTFRSLALLYYILISPASLLLVEEPEVCIHHGLLKSVVEALKGCSINKQIIISTHSELVLDSVLPRNVFVVRRSKTNGTSVQSLSTSLPARELVALKKYLETTGSLGEFWTHAGF